jgi:hypothetical protein
MEHRCDRVPIEEARFGWRHALDQNRGYLLRDGETLGHTPAQKLKERVKNHQPVVARPPAIVSGLFEMLQKPENAFERQRVARDLREPTSHIGCDEGEKEPQRASR